MEPEGSYHLQKKPSVCGNG